MGNNIYNLMISYRDAFILPNTYEPPTTQDTNPTTTEHTYTFERRTPRRHRPASPDELEPILESDTEDEYTTSESE